MSLPAPQNEMLRQIAKTAARAPSPEILGDDAAMTKRGCPWRVTVAVMNPDIEIWHWYYRARPTRYSISAAQQLVGVEFFDFSIVNLEQPARGGTTPSQRVESAPVAPTLGPRTVTTALRHGDAVEAQRVTLENFDRPRWESATFLQALAPVDGEPRYVVRWQQGGARCFVTRVRRPRQQTVGAA